MDKNEGNLTKNDIVNGFYRYQVISRRTVQYPFPNSINGLLYVTLGLAGEAGEFANKVKKILRDDNGKITQERRNDLSEELGDLLWYASQCAYELRLDFGAVAKQNINKLTTRLEQNKIHGGGDKR